MIFLSVGTFIAGFDDLVAATDRAAALLGLEGSAQIGHSAVQPSHLTWQRFYSADDMRSEMQRAGIVVCHGGMGILGDAMRAGCRILAVPRVGETRADHPANDQSAFLRHLAELQPIQVCEGPDDVLPMLAAMLDEADARIDYRLGSNVPDLIAGFLQSLPASSSKPRRWL
ncbi:MAG: glycosyltransferase [Geminicoccaceae bacterium]